MIYLNNIKNSKLYDYPFDHLVVDNFFTDSVAYKLAEQFPVSADFWHQYNNKIENKKVCNQWDKFPKETYQAFWDLCSTPIVECLSEKFNTNLIPDIGLNGGGWHLHGSGGKLNIHKDYSSHPKLNFQRKLNIIIYLSEIWQKDWNGHLELWSDHDGQPKECKKIIEIKFNRAVIFDTTQNSWHGLPETINCPKDTYRKSLAVYYLCEKTEKTDTRSRALFAPYKEQSRDEDILKLIKERSL
jgi:hypothetical protein